MVLRQRPRARPTLSTAVLPTEQVLVRTRLRSGMSITEKGFVKTLCSSSKPSMIVFSLNNKECGSERSYVGALLLVQNHNNFQNNFQDEYKGVSSSAERESSFFEGKPGRTS